MLMHMDTASQVINHKVLYDDVFVDIGNILNF